MDSPSESANTLRIVTTSWDDGDHADVKLAELLRSRELPATFYIPICPHDGRPSLSHAELRALSEEGFEIGAHGYSHKLLWGLSAEKLAEEISPCKPILEDILGSEVRMFCYPRGRYDSQVVRALEKAGYRGARTVRMLSTQLTFNPFEMPTSLQSFPHSSSTYLKNITRGRMKGLGTYLSHRPGSGNWLELGKSLFDCVLENGGVWHLYGHSWELEQLGLWDSLEKLLDYVCGRERVSYVPNGELLQYLPASKSMAESLT